ncbi:MAG: Holliday junction resolvase RuvX [Malacoplasma sp.]
MNILSIDYGEKRIGVAISVKGTSFAVPLDTLDNNQNIFSTIKKIIDEENISLIIVGYPFTTQNYVSQRHELIKEFVLNLEKEFKINVILEDESYSTILSNSVQKDFNVNKKQIAKQKDAVSAQLILERYLIKVGK